MIKRSSILSLIFITLIAFSVFSFTGCEIDTINDDTTDIAADTDSTLPEDLIDNPAFLDDNPMLASNPTDMGYSHSNILLTATEFNTLWKMANLTGRIYRALWDKALAGISTTLIPALDFAGNTKEYSVVETHTANWGFYAETYVRKDSYGKPVEYVLVFRGTEPLSVADWVQDMVQAITTYTNLPSSQYTAAINLSKQFVTKYSGYKLAFAGHSLGGGLAQIACLTNKYIPTYCYDAAGLSSGTINYKYPSGITVDVNMKRYIKHVNVKYDPLTDTQGKMNEKSPDLSFTDAKQYYSQYNRYWVRNIPGTAYTWNPFRIANHFYHAYVYQLGRTTSSYRTFIKKD